MWQANWSRRTQLVCICWHLHWPSKTTPAMRLSLHPFFYNWQRQRWTACRSLLFAWFQYIYLAFIVTRMRTPYVRTGIYPTKFSKRFFEMCECAVSHHFQNTHFHSSRRTSGEWPKLNFCCSLFTSYFLLFRLISPQKVLKLTHHFFLFLPKFSSKKI